MGARDGQHHNWGTVAGDTVSGAASGAALGSLAGPWGTVIGGAIGGAGGFLTGLLSGDSPDPLAAPQAPPPPPDLADEISRRADLAKQMRLMGEGSGDYLSGPLGDTSTASGARAKAGGI